MFQGRNGEQRPDGDKPRVATEVTFYYIYNNSTGKSTLRRSAGAHKPDSPVALDWRTKEVMESRHELWWEAENASVQVIMKLPGLAKGQQSSQQPRESWGGKKAHHTPLPSPRSTASL